MKKIAMLLVLVLTSSAVFAAGVSYKVQNAPKGVHANTGNSYNKSILHTNEGIKGNYEVIKSQNSTGLTKPTTLIETVKKPTEVPSVPIKPANPSYRPTQRYLPVLYTYGWSSADDDKQEINVQNNTYNYYNVQEQQNTKKVQENKSDENKKNNLTKSNDIKSERETLRKKYANILSNKTMSNEKMCSKMAGYFTNVDYIELDRILNEVLLLNCDIEKLRPESVIK